MKVIMNIEFHKMQITFRSVRVTACHLQKKSDPLQLVIAVTHRCSCSRPCSLLCIGINSEVMNF